MALASRLEGDVLLALHQPQHGDVDVHQLSSSSSSSVRRRRVHVVVLVASSSSSSTLRLSSTCTSAFATSA